MTLNLEPALFPCADAASKGSRPKDLISHDQKERTADRYTLMDAWIKLSAKSEAKRMEVSSLSGGKEPSLLRRPSRRQKSI